MEVRKATAQTTNINFITVHNSAHGILSPADGGGNLLPALLPANDDCRDTGSGATAMAPGRQSQAPEERSGRVHKIRHENNHTTERCAPPKAHNSGRHTKAALRIASLNISGKGQINGPTDTGKWNSLNILTREQKFGIIALQETHLDETTVTKIHDIYGRRLRVFFSAPEQGASNSQGVAFVLNREIVDIMDVKQKDLIPGRAILLSMNWHAGRSITLLNIYAPNDTNENVQFWRTLSDRLNENETNKPEVVMGDFNVTEETLDLLPTREDEINRVESLRNFLRPLNLSDGWRINEPTTCDYTFPANGQRSRSRLDRIYVTQEILNSSFNWKIINTGVQTDHRAVTAELSTASAPYIGKGRWTLPLHLLYDQKFWEAITPIGIAATKKAIEMEGGRTETYNPQSILRQFKEDIKRIAKTRLKPGPNY